MEYTGKMCHYYTKRLIHCMESHLPAVLTIWKWNLGQNHSGLRTFITCRQDHYCPMLDKSIILYEAVGSVPQPESALVIHTKRLLCY